jgi:hypothetical protein
VVAQFTSDAVQVLGLDRLSGSRLGALAQEVVGCIIDDAFDPEAELDVDVVIEREPGGLCVAIEDRGAPSSFARGEYPPTVADLVRLGFADDLVVRTEGRNGNRTEIRRNLRYSSLAEDPAFAAEAEAEPASDPLTEEITIRPMVEDDVLGVARLFFRCYGYTAYQASIVYEPERLAEYVRAGRHVATVAVTASGRVVGHLASEVEEPGATTGRIGLLAVDPAYRSRKISGQLGLPHVVRLLELGFVGQYSEAVTVHDRSQRAALAAGGHECGVMLAAQQPSMDFQGLGGEGEVRRAVMVVFGSFGDIPERDVYVPQAYADVATRIYQEAGLHRAIRTARPRGDRALADQTVFTLQLKHEASVAYLGVAEYGRDFDEQLLSQIEQLRLNHFDVIQLFLPLTDPSTAHLGAGLHEMGLSFTGIYPEYGDGDVLVLQSLNNVVVEPSQIVVASDFGRWLLDFVLADRQTATDRQVTRVRSRTRMARVLEALE